MSGATQLKASSKDFSAAPFETNDNMNPQVPILQQAQPLALTQAKRILESGKLLVAPTDTRYGLLCRADDNAALERLFQAKKRPAQLVSAIFLHAVSEIKLWAKVSPLTTALQNRFLPGPLTLVTTATERAMNLLPEKIINNGEIGIRVSGATFISKLLESVSFPVTATSANISGANAPTTILKIAEQLGNEVDLYVDGGELAGDVSTVVRCSESCLEIMREGAIPIDDIRTTLDSEHPEIKIEAKRHARNK